MSNYKAELAKRGLDGHLKEILKEIARIRKELGYPIMVTPLSQYIGAQAILNHTAGERYKIVTDEIIKFVLGHYGEIVGEVDRDVRDRINKLPRTRELLNWEPPQKSMEELRKEFGPELPDEEFLLRVLSSNQEAVDHVLAAGPKNYDYPRGDKPVLALIQELAAQKHAAYIQIKKEDFSLTLRRASKAEK
jgi:oxaloacetate decarboxylase alpha subunit